ncbi:hypothetical protein T265_10262 [Opisthorchis viverrini]|uniref:Uncharacterized protein n=1 Tax=Opisthorchis viverrini TaxID=6198 RepID=A0A075A1V2_OPIVI|nr:hypothetical protein T265_10262 [Opisthorchis viverrini]KER21389.1 hypothetical protein T265_10262 [Opisthorchis viverrini]
MNFDQVDINKTVKAPLSSGFGPIDSEGGEVFEFKAHEFHLATSKGTPYHPLPITVSTSETFKPVTLQKTSPLRLASEYKRLSLLPRTSKDSGKVMTLCDKNLTNTTATQARHAGTIKLQYTLRFENGCQALKMTRTE